MTNFKEEKIPNGIPKFLSHGIIVSINSETSYKASYRLTIFIRWDKHFNKIVVTF